MNLKEVKELIELVTEKGFTEFEIERQGFRMRISRHNQPFPSSQQAVPPAVTALPTPPVAQAPATAHPPQEAAEALAASSVRPAEAAPDSALHIIKSPLIGTFYHAPSPGAEPFVKVGDRVEPETIVCIIEAMKLMNNIQAEVAGEVARIYVEDGQPIEYGQPLFGIKV